MLMALWLNTLDVIYSTAVLWVPILILSSLSAWFCRVLGYRTTVALGCVGTPIHELSHLFLAKLFNHKIIAVSLFNPTPDGRFGYVHHAYKKSFWSSLENLLIGLAPIGGGILSFLLVTKLFMPGLVSEYITISSGFNPFDSLASAFSLVTNALSSSDLLGGSLWVVLSFSILLFSAPSPTDFYGCRAGVITLLVMFAGLQTLAPQVVKGFLNAVAPQLQVFGSLLLLVIAIMSVLFVVVIGVRNVLSRALNTDA